MHKAISIKVQGKTSFETKLNNVGQTFWFSTFYVVFWIFDTRRKRLIKNNNVKTTKANKAVNIQQNHAIQKANKVLCALKDKLTHCKYVKHTSHKWFKKLYQYQWSYGGIQTVDHREAWWRCPPFDCRCVWIQDTQLFPLLNLEWNGNVSLCVWILNAGQDS